MTRFLLMLLVVALIVAGLAWATGPAGPISQASPPPPGPGQAAWLHGIGLPPGPWVSGRAGDTAFTRAGQLFV